MTEPTPVPPAPAEDDEPLPERYRSFTPSEPAEIRRKLLFGGALVLSTISVYAGLLEWGRVPQFGFAGLAVAAVLIALISGATGPPRPVGTIEAATPTPTPPPAADSEPSPRSEA